VDDDEQQQQQQMMMKGEQMQGARVQDVAMTMTISLVTPVTCHF